MAAHARERHDVGLQTRAAARIGRSEGQNDRRNFGLRVADIVVKWQSFKSQHFNLINSSALPIARRTILPSAMTQTPHNPQEYKTYMCLICGWLYNEATGAPEDGIPAGTRWEDVPINWTCPECGARKDDFEMVVV